MKAYLFYNVDPVPFTVGNTYTMELGMIDVYPDFNTGLDLWAKIHHIDEDADIPGCLVVEFDSTDITSRLHNGKTGVARQMRVKRFKVIDTVSDEAIRHHFNK